LEEYYADEAGAKKEVTDILKQLLGRKKKTEEAIKEENEEEE